MTKMGALIWLPEGGQEKTSSPPKAT
jgi:hypothetical protein